MTLKASIAIPTYNRERVLLNTLDHLLKQREAIEEILLIDQTTRHTDAVEKKLYELNSAGLVRLIRLRRASVPLAMNKALEEARSDIILFLDDDIIPSDRLVQAHLESFLMNEGIWAVVGRVIQPEIKLNERAGRGRYLDFNFASTEMAYVQNVMAGNMSVKRLRAIEIGGFDENFIGAAYRFETEFAERLTEKGGKILFNPEASITHLREKTGGVRAHGDFRTTSSAAHSVGAYYYFLRSKKIRHPVADSLKRFIGSVWAKHYLYKPWWIPVTLIAELRGIFQASRLALKGPKFISQDKQINDI